MSKRGPHPSHLALVDATAAIEETSSSCRGRTKSGGACKKPAGQGTGHPGVGQCQYHDGQVEAGSPCPLPLNERGFLGVEGKATGKEFVEITKVIPGSGAETVGIEVGDVLIEIDEIPIKVTKTIVDYLSHLEPDTKVKVKVLRKKRPRLVRFLLCDAAMQAGLAE